MKKSFCGMSLFIFLFLPLIGKTESQINVRIDVAEDNTATIDVGYPVNSDAAAITVLASNNSGKSFDAGITLIGAKSDKGDIRSISEDGDGDARVEIKPGDTQVIVKYSLSNFIKSDDVGLFNFGLVFGNSYPSSVEVSVQQSNNIELFFPISRNQNTGEDRKVFTLASDGGANGYTYRDLMFITHSKGVYSAYTRKDIGKYILISPNNKADQLYKAMSDLGSLDQVFQYLFGFADTNSGKIIVVVFPFGKQRFLSGGGEAGFALPAMHTVFVDTQELSYQKTSTLAKRLIVHELAHLYLGSSNGPFSERHIKWMDEGLAVFAADYASDKYSFSKKDIASLPFGNRPFTLDELKKAYQHQFDFNFKINTNNHMVVETYTQSGLIFYNLFLKDPLSIKRLVTSVKKYLYNNSCRDCDPIFALDQIKQITGMTEQDIIYPYKDGLNTQNENLNKLLLYNDTAGDIKKDEVTHDMSVVIKKELNVAGLPEQKIIVDSTSKESTFVGVDNNEKKENINLSDVSQGGLIENIFNFLKRLFKF